MTLQELLEQTKNKTARKLIQDEIDVFGVEDRATPGLIYQVSGFQHVPNKTSEEYSQAESHRKQFHQERVNENEE